MKIIELEQPIIGDIVEFVTDPDTVVEGLIIEETEDGYIYEFSELGLKELNETCTHGKYYCSTDKKWKCRQGPKQSRNVSEGDLTEFAPGNGSESGRWYTDDQMTDIVGDGWWQDMDISGNIPKQQMIQQAQDWLNDQGYSVQVLNIKLNDDDCDWFIEGSFHNPNFAKKDVAEAHPNDKMYDQCWDGYKKVPGKKRGEKGSCVKEAEYQGREVPLGKPMKGDVKKSKVYVRNAQGNVVKVNFGDPNMRIKKTSPKHRKSFRARHNCDNPGPRWKARYWSCRAW